MAESQTVETEVQVAPEQPVAKMSPEEFSSKLKSGEIDTSGADPQELIEKMVDMGDDEAPKEKPSEQALGGATEEVVAEAPVEAPAEEVAPYKNIGELMADATEALGEKIPNARALVAKTKNQKEHLHKMEGALEKWKVDATSNEAKIAELEGKLAESQKVKESVAPVASQPKAPAEAKMPDFETEIPEIEKPGDFADVDDVAKHMDKKLNRANLIAQKKMDWLQGENKRAQKDYEERIRKTNEDAQAKIDIGVRTQQEQDAAKRAAEDTMNSANDFAGRHKELGIGDVADANQKYCEWSSQIEHVKKQNPAYVNRNLVADYFNGVSDAVGLLDGYGVAPPSGAKEVAFLIELQDIATTHNMRDAAGRLDFEEAYVLKKSRDGIDREETNNQVAKAVEQTLDVVQQRQAAPQSLGAEDVSATAPAPEVTTDQISERIAQLQGRMSTMRPDEREKAMKEVDELMTANLGVEPINAGA